MDLGFSGYGFWLIRFFGFRDLVFQVTDLVDQVFQVMDLVNQVNQVFQVSGSGLSG